MDNSLHILANRVKDERSFIEFLQLMMQDRRTEVFDRNSELSSYNALDDDDDNWQNNTIEEFLLHSVAWAQTTENIPKFYSVPPNSWRRAAQILLSGKNKQ